jgi:pyruvate kinase
LKVTHVSRTVRRTRVDATVHVAAPAPEKQFILLKPGDPLRLTGAGIPGRPATYGERGQLLSPATISCTLTEVFADVRPNERIWFDDGKIGGVIESVEPGEVLVRITSAKPSGDSLRADKGINLPDSCLRLPALTEKDLGDLDFAVAHADLIGLSFVKRPDDIRELHAQLARRNASHLGVMLKIETRTGFEQLPHLLLASMRGPQVGVMIARGDLAVECGWERLAEVQEEILWVCEAAHVPVVWATQVLEGLAKKGVPSRAEITDAAMSERAECVMLNKGPHLIEAVQVLDDILRRMEAHQSKKTARLRPLRLSTMPAAS